MAVANAPAPDTYAWTTVRSWKMTDALLPGLSALGYFLAALYFSGVSVNGLFRAPTAIPPIAAYLWFALILVVLYGTSSHYSFMRSVGVGFTLPVLASLVFLGLAAIVMGALQPWSILFLVTGTVGALPAMYAGSHQDHRDATVRFDLWTSLFLSGIFIAILSGIAAYYIPGSSVSVALVGAAIAQVGVAVFLAALMIDFLRAQRLQGDCGVVGFFGGTDVLFVIFLVSSIVYAAGLARVVGIPA